LRRDKVTFTRRFFGDLLLEVILIAVTLFIGWLIWLYFTAQTGQTPAKRLLNVLIVDLDTDQPVSAGRVWMRDVLVKIILFSWVFGAITFGISRLIDYGWVLIDDNRQALHDKIVNTRVVYSPFKLR